MTGRPTIMRHQAGFTLVELTITVVMLGVLAHYAVAKWTAPATLTLRSQVESVAELVRRAQNLATVRGQRMAVNVSTSGANGTIAIACTTGTMPCNTDSSLALTQNVAVSNSAAVYFSSLGMPVDNAGAPRTTDASFTLSYASRSYTVSVAALTGRVSVSP